MERRLTRIDRALGADEPEPGQIAYAHLPSWPAEAVAAFLQADASGDDDTIDDLVEAQTGTRPTRGGRRIGVIVDLPYGTEQQDLAVVKTRSVNKETQR